MMEHVNLALTEATRRVVFGIADFLPGLAALILAVIVSCLLAWIFSWIVRRSLRGVDFDERLDQWGFSALADWSPDKSPTLLVSRAVAWGIILMGFLVGLTALQAELASAMVARLFGYLPNLVVGLVVLAIGSVLARYLARGVLIGAVNLNLHSARLLSMGVKWLVLVLTAAMALDHLRIGGDIVKLAFAILFGGIVLALALAVGLGSKDLVTRSLEKQTREEHGKEVEEQFHHL
ncbi:MAG: hypothetical protein IPM24_14435 [Bryobacterales bacterium]|nr:hypothetical protein [Bryobacterales bacterium]